MMQGPIRRLPRERVERRDDALLPSAWIAVNDRAAPLDGLTWLVQGPTSPMPADGGSAVLVMLGSGEESALEELLNHAGAGRRVYVLVPPSWGERSVEPRVLRTPKVLFRRIAEVPVSGVHTSHGARLWIGGSWSLRLDAQQSDAFRQVFLRLFWHEASHEAWSGGKQLAWRAAGARPFDVPDLPRGAPLLLVAADAHLDTRDRSALVHLSGGPPPETAPRRLWLPAGADHHDELTLLSRKGTDVVWQDRGLPDLMVDGKRDEILLPGRHARLRVLATSEQAAEVARVLEASARWTFGVDLRVGDMAARGASCWLPGEPGAREIQPEQVTIEIDPEGRITADAEGFSGDVCLRDLDRLLEGLSPGNARVDRKPDAGTVRVASTRTQIAGKRP